VKEEASAVVEIVVAVVAAMAKETTVVSAPETVTNSQIC
jgi:hypothetical protein